MYTHLLVPVDDSVLSSTNVGVAVELAQRLGSRITFFHAAADLGATRAGASLKARDPDGFAESAFGDTLAVLSQHAMMAESAGVRYDTVYQTDDRRAEAIVDAAGQHGCDLIVMASHGPRGLAGWLQGSHTERVLRQSSIPVLVTRVTANEPVKAVELVMAAIGDEHRSILAVALAMQDMVRQVPGSWTAQELACLEAMLEFLHQLSSSIHHPKEEQYLHTTLRKRAPQLPSSGRAPGGVGWGSGLRIWSPVSCACSVDYGKHLRSLGKALAQIHHRPACPWNTSPARQPGHARAAGHAAKLSAPHHQRRAMQLLANITSPFVRIARTAMIEKGIGLDLTIVDPWADDARLHAANAATRVPTLVLDDGTPLTEAMLIVQWLEAITAVTLYDYQQLRYADQPWLPRTPRLQALAEAWRWRESFRKTMPFVA